MTCSLRMMGSNVLINRLFIGNLNRNRELSKMVSYTEVSSFPLIVNKFLRISNNLQAKCEGKGVLFKIIMNKGKD